jgi:hypothetical protein
MVRPTWHYVGLLRRSNRIYQHLALFLKYVSVLFVRIYGPLALCYRTQRNCLRPVGESMDATVIRGCHSPGDANYVAKRPDPSKPRAIGTTY